MSASERSMGRTSKGCFKETTWTNKAPLAPVWTTPKMIPDARTPPTQPHSGALERDEAAPPKVRTRNQDMFVGHGMYNSLWPIGYAMAFFGLLPITFHPIRISLHPLHSTLVYCLGVTALVLWSGHYMLVERLALFLDPRVTLQTRFNSVLSMTDALGLGLLPLLWLEARNMHRNEALCASLMDTFPGCGRCRWAVTLSWVTVINSVLVTPTTATLYVHVIAKEGGSDTHLLLHNHVQLVVFCVSALLATQAHCVKNYGNGLRRGVTEELSRPYPCAKRLLAFRRAWLKLRDLTQGMVVMPLTTMYLLLFGLLMTTLGSYLCLVCFFEGQIVRGVFMIILGCHFFGLILLVCDAVHRTTTAVGEQFLRPLETYCSTGMVGDTAMDEINIFREIVAAKEITVSAAGFWTINRGTMSALTATAASYLVILIQFRQTEDSAKNVGNRTLESNAFLQ